MSSARSLPLAALVSLAIIAIALPAQAAEPASGTLSDAAPSLQWSGEAGGYGTSVVADINGQFPEPCEQPNCDTFDLELKDSGDLTVTLRTNEGAFMTMEVEDPSGTITYNGGSEDSDTTTIKLKKAKTGKYIVRAMTNNTPAEEHGYTGVATLGSPPAAATPAPAGPPAPGATPTPSGQSPAAAQPAARIIVRSRTGSARKARKGMVVKLTVTSKVTRLSAVLRRGKSKKAYAKGKLAKVSKTGKLKLRTKRRLKRGTYKLTLRAKDASSGATVATTVKFKVKR